MGGVPRKSWRHYASPVGGAFVSQSSSSIASQSAAKTAGGTPARQPSVEREQLQPVRVMPGRE
jgi:hypothetical protein